MTVEWLAVERRLGAVEVQLVTFPYAGGSASVYRSWSEWLPPAVELCLALLPGRERRIGEPAFERIDALVAEFAGTLPATLDRPYVLFGHSMGATVAYELTREIERRGGRAPAGLIVSGQRAPHCAEDSPRIHDLPDGEFVDAIRRLGGTPPEVFEHVDLVELLLPLLRADFSAVETHSWSPGPPLEIPIAVFTGESDDVVEAGDAAAWSEQTTAWSVVETFPGSHFFVLERPEVVAQRAGAVALDFATRQLA